MQYLWLAKLIPGFSTIFVDAWLFRTSYTVDIVTTPSRNPGSLQVVLQSSRNLHVPKSKYFRYTHQADFAILLTNLLFAYLDPANSIEYSVYKITGPRKTWPAVSRRLSPIAETQPRPPA